MSKTKLIHISVLVSKEIAERVKAEAAEMAVSKSAICRLALIDRYRIQAVLETQAEAE